MNAHPAAPDIQETIGRAASPRPGASQAEAATSAIADWLALAAAPVLAAMALLAALPGRDPQAFLCSGGGGAWPLTGMAAMYLLMSAFHLAPWLRLAARLHAWRRRP